MLAMMIFSISMTLWTLLMGVLGLPLLAWRRVPFWFCTLWARGALFCFRLSGKSLAYKGTENIPEGSAIIASQHQSALETIAFASLLRCPAYVLKKELHYIPIFGWYLARANMVSIDRSARVRALHSVMSQADSILSQGRKMVIFPEGTRVPVGKSYPYNKSIYKLYSLGYPVVPVALNSGVVWSKGSLCLGRGLVRFSFLPPMPKGLSQADFMEQLRSAIETEAETL